MQKHDRWQAGQKRKYFVPVADITDGTLPQAVVPVQRPSFHDELASERIVASAEQGALETDNMTATQK